MKVAEDDPSLVLVTDWTYLTSEEYNQVALDSGYNILYVNFSPSSLLVDVD